MDTRWSQINANTKPTFIMDCTPNTVCRLHFTHIVSIVLVHWKNNASVVTLPLFLKISLTASAFNNIGESHYGSHKINYRFDKKRWRKIG